MSESTIKEHDDGTWYRFSALDQWLWILRHQLRNRDKRSHRFTLPTGVSEQPLADLLGRHAEQHGDQFPPEVLKISNDVAGFLKGAYKAVFRGAPLEAWEGLLSTAPRELLPLTRHESRVMSSLSRFWQL